MTKYDWQRHPEVPKGTLTTRGYLALELGMTVHPKDANVFVFHDKDMKVLGMRQVFEDGTYKEVV